MGPHDRLKGTVKWFDSRRGFGFITPESNHGDVFVHQSSIEAVGFRSLTAGEAVEFLLSVGGDGHSSAVSVTGPGGVCIQGRRCFDHAWFSCNEVAYMTGNCKSNPSFGGIDLCYNRKEAGHIDSQCTIIPKMLKPWKVDLGISSGLRANAFHSEVKERSDEKSESEPQRGEGWRNWAELPDDLLMVIFKKFTAAEILRSVQYVCRPWRQLSFVPALWRFVDMRMDGINHDLESLAMMAVARSAGCIEELYMEEFPTEKLMCYIERRAPLLRRLHLIYVCLEVYSLVEAIRNFQLLEELVILRSSSSIQEIDQVAQACPQLKSFALNEKSYKRADSDADSDLEVDPDTEALAIAKHMKQLRRLQLIGNGLTSRGLLAILNNCLHLEYLDIRRCFYIDFDEYLKNKCTRIKTLRVPNDSLADYDYTISESDCDDATDFEPNLSDTEFWSPYVECFEMDYYDETY